MEAFLISCAFFLIILGCVFVFLPGLPGPVVAWCGPLVYFIFSTAEPPTEWIGVKTLAIAGVFAALVMVFDFVSSWWGATKFGATWRGGLGAFVGAIVGPIVFSPIGGFFGMLLGLLVGPIVGAVLGEIIGGRNFFEGTRAGWGTLIGALIATCVKLFYCLSIFVWFIAALIF